MKTTTTNAPRGHRGPNPGILAALFMALFITGLGFVVSFSPGQPHFPYPYDAIATIEAYFRDHAHDALLCSFFMFGAAIPLGLFTSAMVSRLRYHGISAAGVDIALFGGYATALFVMLSALLLWTAALPAISHTGTSIDLLYYTSFGTGGVGYSVPLGLLIAGIAITGGLSGLLPKWLAWSGVVIALIGELSWLNMIYPQALLLIPLTRFPGFIWLIIAGFKLPAMKRETSTAG